MKLAGLVSVICLSSLTLALPGPLLNEPRSAEDDLKDYLMLVLENLRSEMPRGIPALSIPPLDPFELNEQVFNISDPKATVHLEFPHLRVVGLSTFKADLEIQMGRMALEVDLEFQHLKASGLYKLDGKIMKLFPIYGDGDLRVDLAGPKIVLAAQLGAASNTLSIDITKMDITWKNLNVHLGNFLGPKGSLSRVLEMFLPTLGKKMLTTFNPQILKGLSGLINGVIAEQTAKPEIRDMLKQIFGGDYSGWRQSVLRHPAWAL